jgi:hypothetical protein
MIYNEVQTFDSKKMMLIVKILLLLNYTAYRKIQDTLDAVYFGVCRLRYDFLM